MEQGSLGPKPAAQGSQREAEPLLSTGTHGAFREVALAHQIAGVSGGSGSGGATAPDL